MLTVLKIIVSDCIECKVALLKKEYKMTLNQYNKSKEILYDIWYLKPTVEQISKDLKLMYKSLCEEWGFLCKKEILEKIVNDTFTIGLSNTKIRQLLWGRN